MVLLGSLAPLGSVTFVDPERRHESAQARGRQLHALAQQPAVHTRLAYAFTEWFTAGARITNTFSERSPDGELRAPLNPLDTRVGVDLSVSFDKLYMSTRGHGGS